MNVKFGCAAMALVFVFSAHAQVRKCMGPNGQITYSDSVCDSQTSRETTVRTDANTIDSSGLRQAAANTKTKEAVDRAMQSDSGQCKFSYYELGDSLGQELAKSAKKECLDNIAAKVTGAQTSQEAYNRWKDHFNQKSANRNAAIARNKTYTCKPNLLGSALDCR